jgi:TonB family protein
LGNFCGYCENLKNAANYEDAESRRLYNKGCSKKITVQLFDTTQNKIRFFNVIRTDSCTRMKDVDFFHIDNHGDTLYKGNATIRSGYVVGKEPLKRDNEEAGYVLKIDTLPPAADGKKYISSYSSYTITYEFPSFPGGDEARIRFLMNNIRYPQMAKESGIQGTVYISFNVDEKGQVSDVKILRGIGGGCDEESVRVVKLMPPWNPGKENGKPVKVKYSMSIRFALG